MKQIPFFIALLIICSCSTPEIKEPCHCNTSAVEKNKVEVDRMRFKGYKDYLRIWRIPPLAGYAAESYRICTMQAFENTRIITIVKTDAGAKMSTAVYNDQRPTGKETVVRSRSTRMLSKGEWKKIRLKIHSNCFWTEPMGKMKPVLDGGSWLIEGYDPSESNCGKLRYHANFSQMGESNSIAKLGYYLSHLN